MTKLISDYLPLQFKTLGLSGILKPAGLEIYSVPVHRVLRQGEDFSTEDSVCRQRLSRVFSAGAGPTPRPAPPQAGPHLLFLLQMSAVCFAWWGLWGGASPTPSFPS